MNEPIARKNTDLLNPAITLTLIWLLRAVIIKIVRIESNDKYACPWTPKLSAC